jgi:hypothetical protein
MDTEFLDGEFEGIPMVAGDNLEERFKNLAEAIKDKAALDRNRPYRCQQPKRHQQLVSGLTMRDIRDCAIRGFLLCTGVDQPELYHKVENGTCCADDIYLIDFVKIDPIAALQNMQCEIEKMMDIYPNLLD